MEVQGALDRNVSDGTVNAGEYHTGTRLAMPRQNGAQENLAG